MRFIWFVTAAAIFVAAVGAARAEPAARPGVWAQTYVNRPVDPAVRFGQLPNGLRYAVLRNAIPLKQVSLRLVIGSGSLAEGDDQQGLAHFVEHMAFRGSTHVADGELIRTLERHGLSLGADTNAFTTQESTFYQFDLPANDAPTIDIALGFLRETVSELTFDAGRVEAERAVILAEERLRDGPALHVQQAALRFVLTGQRAAERWPIGLTATIAHATPAALRAFYQAQYQPANATVIVVGDIDPAAMVAAITARFGAWPAGSAPLAAAEPETPALRAAAARIFTEPGVSHSVEVAWVRPFDGAADTSAHYREIVLNFIATRIFNQRLQDIAFGPNPPFFTATMERTNVVRSANVTSFAFRGAFARWPEALAKVIGDSGGCCATA